METLYDRDALKEKSIAELLILPLSDIAEVIGFKLPPKGSYVLTIKECKLGAIGAENDQKEAIMLDLVVDTTVELETQTDEPLPAGAEFNVNYIGGGSLPFFKTDFKDVSPQLGVSQVGQLIEALNGKQIRCVIGHNVNKKDPEDIKRYPKFSSITLV